MDARSIVKALYVLHLPPLGCYEDWGNWSVSSPLTERFLCNGIKMHWCIPPGVLLYCPHKQLSPYQPQCLLLVEPKAEQWHLSKYQQNFYFLKEGAEKTGIDFESRVDSWLLCLSKCLDLPSSASQHYPHLPFPEQMSGFLCRALSFMLWTHLQWVRALRSTAPGRINASHLLSPRSSYFAAGYHNKNNCR